MGKRIYPLKGIKYWWAYTVEEICEMYSDCNLHPQTVREWIRKGLIVISGKPMLIYGNDLKKFLMKMNQSNKCHTQFDEMFCFTCKEASNFYKKQIKVIHKDGKLDVKALCRHCKNVMNQGYKLDDYQTLKRLFLLVDELQLYDCENPPLKTHLDVPQETHANEPIQMELL
jgi:hypothetical protein